MCRRSTAGPTADLSADARERVEQLIEEEEGSFNRLGGSIGMAIAAFAVFVSLFHLYAAYDDRAGSRAAAGPCRHGAGAVLSAVSDGQAASATASAGGTICSPRRPPRTMLYVLSQGADFGDRATLPTTTDWLVGAVFIVLLLEGTRRATGLIMPGVAIAFLLYALTAITCRIPGRIAAMRSRTSSRIST